MNELEDKKKQVVGLYGEMRLSMELHELGWQVHRAYFDEDINFIIIKYWCPKCKKYSNQWIRKELYKGKSVKCVTNLCEHCNEKELPIREDGTVLKKGSAATCYDYSVFNTKFYYNFRALEIETKT